MARKKIIDVPTVLPTAETLQPNPENKSEIKLACERQGLSLDNYILAIKDALEATRTTVDKYGDEHTDADHDKRLKAAMMGLELEGYIKAKGAITDNSKHTHVTYAWLTTPIKMVRE